MRKFTFFILTLFIMLTLIPVTYAEEKLPAVDSPSMIVLDSGTGQILYEKDIHKKLYPASITKVMTALIALERCDLNEKVTASRRAVFSIEPGSSTASFQEGEVLTVEQLLYALMLNSANEAANILAEYIGGSIENFSDIMNKRAMELGTVNTHFVNPNGLHNDNHYTTVYDMSLISKQAMSMPAFKKIVSTKKYNMPPTNKYDKTDKIFWNTNKLIHPSAKNYYEYAIGGKTGYTTKAGHSLVASAMKSNLNLIAVSMNSQTGPKGIATYVDSIKLFEYFFENYEVVYPVEAGSLVTQLPVKGAQNDIQLQVVAEKSLGITAPKNTAATYTTNVEIFPNLKAPIAKGSIVGKLEVQIKGTAYGTTNLISGNNIARKEPLKLLGLILKIIGIILLFIIGFILIMFLSVVIWAKKTNRKIKVQKKEKPYSHRIYGFMDED